MKCMLNKYLKPNSWSNAMYKYANTDQFFYNIDKIFKMSDPDTCIHTFALSKSSLQAAYYISNLIKYSLNQTTDKDEDYITKMCLLFVFLYLYSLRNNRKCEIKQCKHPVRTLCYCS